MKGITAELYPKPEPTMTSKDVMEALHIKDRRTFYKLINAGLPYIKLGKEYIIKVSSFNKWLSDCEEKRGC